MRGRSADIVVAGHICLDVIPSIPGNGETIDHLLIPGKLIDIGPALLSTGGAVSNTGLALHRLGVPVTLMGKVGDDLFGESILQLLRGYGDELAEGMIVAANEPSSYTLVISPPGVDRIFLHCTGANDTFCAEDVLSHSLQGSRLFHFGYPPLMRKMYEDLGSELARLLSGVKAQGLTVSLDLARPDPDSAAGKVDWKAILIRTLPYVDLFLPSFEEILYMLRPQTYREFERSHGSSDMIAYADGDLLASLAEELISMGVAIAAIKLGEHGLYVRTCGDKVRLMGMGECSPIEEGLDCWVNRELLVPCFQVDVRGTTGAGDCTIAGFLTGITKGLPLEDVLLGAVGVGACNVEQADAVSGVPSWERVQSRISEGWKSREIKLPLKGFLTHSGSGIRERRRLNDDA